MRTASDNARYNRRVGPILMPVFFGLRGCEDKPVPFREELVGAFPIERVLSGGRGKRVIGGPLQRQRCESAESIL